MRSCGAGQHHWQHHTDDTHDRQSGARVAGCTTPCSKKIQSLQYLDSPEIRQLDMWTLSAGANKKLRSQLAGSPIQKSAHSAQRLWRPLLSPKEPEHAGCAPLVLDLDETLVHSSTHAPPPGTKSFQLHDRFSGKIMHVAVRPGVAAFLAIMAEHCEIVLFTAATQVRQPRMPMHCPLDHALNAPQQAMGCLFLSTIYCKLHPL